MNTEKSNEQKKHILDIHSLSEEGWGIADYLVADATMRKCVVPYTLPNERVEAVCERTKRYSLPHEAKEIVLLKESQSRTVPKCSHFGECGGCRLQHATYDFELADKQDRIQKLFAPLFEDKSAQDLVFLPIVRSPLEWQYRNKMEFSFSQDAKGNRYLGLIIIASRGKVFNLEECHLVDPWFAQACKVVRSWWQSTSLQAYRHFSNQGALRTLTLRYGQTSHDRMVILTVSGNPDFALHKHEIDSFVQVIQKEVGAHLEGNLSIVLRIHQIMKGQPTQIYEMMLSGPDHLREFVELKTKDLEKTIEFHISPQAFFQPNTKQASYLYSKAIELARITKDDIVYDLYCGVGVFGMCAAFFAKAVYGIELSPDSAYDAKTNGSRLGIENYHLYEGDVGKILGQWRESNIPRPDCIIVDPPRSGLDAKAIQNILDCAAKKIIYVSCNPKTQVENVKLLEQAGYRIKAIQPVDQFPHTMHVENICVLER